MRKLREENEKYLLELESKYGEIDYYFERENEIVNFFMNWDGSDGGCLQEEHYDPFMILEAASEADGDALCFLEFLHEHTVAYLTDIDCDLMKETIPEEMVQTRMPAYKRKELMNQLIAFAVREDNRTKTYLEMLRKGIVLAVIETTQNRDVCYLFSGSSVWVFGTEYFTDETFTKEKLRTIMPHSYSSDICSAYLAAKKNATAIKNLSEISEFFKKQEIERRKDQLRRRLGGFR
ncbi:MAG: hypothetical protein Q4B26_00225 [Eubacteriales bacterium]|nr:hypothetical protein [Eubacteriales bacterium]